jgi:outer membrane protease
MPLKRFAKMAAVFGAALACLSWPAAAGAGQEPADRPLALDAEVSLGSLQVSARETVYVPYEGRRYRLSELDWRSSALTALGLRASAAFSRRLFLDLAWQTSLTRGRGEMQDFDWMQADAPWTDWSRSEAFVEGAQTFDAAAGVPFLPALRPVECRAVLGYRRISCRWSDRGQEYVYSSYAFRDSRGSLEGLNLVNYEQWFSFPYAGLRLGTDGRGFSLSGAVLVSPLVTAGEWDQHVQRQLLFAGQYSGGKFLEASLSGAFELRPQLQFVISAGVQHIPEFMGDMQVVGTETTLPGGAGIAFRSVTAGAGVRRSF